jgi:hypothetical protein
MDFFCLGDDNHAAKPLEILMPNAKLRQLVILFIVAGCTTHPGKDHVADNASGAGPDVQCHSEQITGSIIAKSVCTTKAQRDAQQAALADLKRAMAAQGACPSSSAPGCQ